MENSKPRILIAASIYPPDPGGPAIHAKAQYEGFRRLGLETGLVALADYRSLPIGARHLAYLFKLLSQVRRYDLVYAHDALGAGIPAYLAARAFRRKYVVRIGGDIAWERKAEKGETGFSLVEWYKAGMYASERTFKLSRWLITRADAVIVPSKLLSDIYGEYYGVVKERLHVIANPVPASKEVGSKQECTIVYASRLVAYKNLPFALRAMVRVFAEHPGVKFVVMGDGPERAKLEAFSKELGIQMNVAFMGSVPQSEVLETTASCLFALGPALTEFNPNYILQALAAGKPFLISRENGFAFDVPKDFLFDPRNQKELEDKILNLLTVDGYEKAQYAAQNINFKMTWDDNLEANKQIVLSLLEGHK